ncbi:MAG: hypothetical protein JST11_11135 [Acidobacteria bacterium]|nr:hypothetical protein [Acidobacteriota bacterium]
MALLTLACIGAAAQTRIDLRSQTKAVDFSAAGATRPMKTGTTLPSTCATGEMFFKTDAPPGANLYGCTGANTWSVQSGISSQSCWYDTGDATLKCRDASGNTYTAVRTASGGTASQWIDYIAPSGVPHTSRPTAADVGALGDPGANGIAYRSGAGTTVPAGADQISAATGCEDNGTHGNAYACALSPAIAAYRAGTTYWFKAGAANTGPATLSFNGLPAKIIKKLATQDVSANDILAGQWVMVTYDGVNMQMQSQPANPPGTLVSSVFGRTGLVTGQTGDYTTAQVTESGNLYFTNARAQAAFSFPGVVRQTGGTVDCPTCVTTGTSADTDLSGTFPHLSVTRIQGRAVASTQPTDLQYLGWNNSASRWEPKTLPVSPVTSIFGRTGAVTAQAGDYTFAQISGTASASQVPAVVMRTDQSNTVTAGTQDLSGASHTLPMKTGLSTSLPATCQVGETYFASDAQAGKNVYGCTAANAWSVEGGLPTVQTEGVVVGSRDVTNYVAGPGLVSLLTDTGSGIDVQWSLDTAVVQTQSGEQSGTALLCASSSGSATDYRCSLSPAAVKYATGMVLHWNPDITAAGGPTTLNVDSLGAKPVVLADGVSNPTPGDLVMGHLYSVWYDGSKFRLAPTTVAAVGGLTDPGANGVIYRSAAGTTGNATADQISGSFFCQDVGTAGEYGCDINPPLTGYTNGSIYWFKAGTTNTGAAAVNFNSLGPKAIKKFANQQLAAGDIIAGQWVMLAYDGTSMQMLSQPATGGTGGGSGGSVASVFGRTGAVTAQAGDYSTAQVTESGNLYFTDARARSAVTWSTLSGIPATFAPSAHAASHENGGPDEIATGTPAPYGIPKADAGGRLSSGWLPLPGASSIGGVQAADCGTTGFVQKINSDGSVGCAAGGSGSGGTSRSYSYVWQGAVQAGSTGFAVNLPAAGAPSLTNSGAVRASAVLEWPTGQSTYYAWWTFVLPAGYPANGAITYTLETRSADGTNPANVYLGAACSSTVLDNPNITEAGAVSILAAAASGRTVTSGALTPSSGGLPSCSAGQRVWINMRVDTNVAGQAMNQPFDLASAVFSVQGGI